MLYSFMYMYIMYIACTYMYLVPVGSYTCWIELLDP